jgi:acid phosphatase type 7
VTRPTRRLYAAAAALAATLVPATLSSSPAAGRPAAIPVIAAAGDIACGPANPNFNDGNGYRLHCGQARTAELLIHRGVDAVLPLGDLQYDTGQLHAFRRSYDLSWGKVKRKTHPAPGNHEYFRGAARGYFDYFNGVGRAVGRAGRRGLGWYSYELGSWHLVALNSNCEYVGCSGDSRQLRWLRANLARHRNRCTIAYFHHPLFASGDLHGRSQPVKPFWKALYRAGAELILNGHEHYYERFYPQTPRGGRDPRHGVTEFIVGTGGHSLFGVPRLRRNSRAFQNTTFGVLRLRLGVGGYKWRFLSAPKATVLDQGRARCHGPLPGYNPDRYLPG